MRRLILLVVLLYCAPLGAAQPKPAFLQPDVIKAAIDIALSEQQQPQFRAAVGRMFDGRMRAINRLLRSNNKTDLSRKIKRKTNVLFQVMDDEMAGFLTEAQMPAYQVYRQALKANMRGT